VKLTFYVYCRADASVLVISGDELEQALAVCADDIMRVATRCETVLVCRCAVSLDLYAA
jgi:hypothetical protein